MTSLISTREVSRSVLLRCCSISSPTLLHRKVVRCLTRIYSSLDRVEKFSPFLLNCTIHTLESMSTVLDLVSQLSCIDDAFGENQGQSSEEEVELVDLLSKLWQLYMDLDVGLRMQEVTTPAPHLLPKLKCKTSHEASREKSPLARVSTTRFQLNNIVSD